MLQNDLIENSSLKFINENNLNLQSDGGLVAVLGRAGVGKTPFIVHVALNTLLKNQKVIHISTKDPIDKVSLIYKEIFNKIVGLNNENEYEKQEIDLSWENLLRLRFIIKHKPETFSLSTLVEKTDLFINDNDFLPKTLIVDGFLTDDDINTNLEQLKNFALSYNMNVFLSIRTHRHEKTSSEGIPENLDTIKDLFEALVQICPENDKNFINILANGVSNKSLFIDPNSMLIKDIK